MQLVRMHSNKKVYLTFNRMFAYRKGDLELGRGIERNE